MFLDTSKTTAKSGKVYTRILLRQSYRDGGKVKHRTLGNLTDCPEDEIAAIRFALKNKANLPPSSPDNSGGEGFSLKQGLSAGAVFLLTKITERLGITAALGNNRQGKLALWQIIARVIDQGSRLSATRLASTHAACDILGFDGFNEDDLYENLDWICDQQVHIEERLFKRRFADKPPELFLYDVTSSYLEGWYNELAAFGYNRDGKKGKKQIVVGLLCDKQGDPIAIEVFKGNTSDVKTMPSQITKAAVRFGCSEVTFVGDRGMIKSAVIDQIHEHECFHYITALTKPQIEKLLKTGTLQLSLFDKDVVEIHDTDAKVRYVLRRNDCRAKEIAISRQDKLRTVEIFTEHKNRYLAEHPKATVEAALNAVTARIKALRLNTWLTVTGEAGSRTLTLHTARELLEEESKLDGCYVITTDLESHVADAQTIHDRYKDLAKVERAFRTSKTAELEMRPINVRREKRTRGHILVVMLAYMVARELNRLWNAIDLTVQEGINELTTLCMTELVFSTGVKINSIPQPRESVKNLLDAASVTLPPVIRNRGAIVATRKKLPDNRNAPVK